MLPDTAVYIGWETCEDLSTRAFIVRQYGCNRVWHLGDPTHYFAHAQGVITEGTWPNTLGVENSDKSKILKKLILLTNIITTIYDL